VDSSRSGNGAGAGMNPRALQAWFRVVMAACLVAACGVAGMAVAQPAKTWVADNGNGSFTNPIFHDEFSDPDLIRVGDDFYMVGTTMHAVPGLPVLHSRDLVNWTFLAYAMPGFGPGDEFRLSSGREIYGQGIWAPCIRYHDGTFYIFSNINGHGLQVFTARDPAGPWRQRSLGRSLHDLSVLFDDDGRVYAVYDYQQVRMVELKPDMSGFVEGSERVVIPAGQAMGEGHHFYKVDGRYYIISANYAPVGRMQAARADRPEGPYETVVISAGETMGTQRGWWLDNVGQRDPVPTGATQFRMHKPGDNALGAVPLHQGGIVQLANGQWWGFSMMDVKSIGRTTFLSPVTWQDGWPYFGLPGNLGRSPRTWTKPDVGIEIGPTATWQRSDDFSGPALEPLWQWNHEPVAGKWSLSEKPGALRLHTQPADGFLWARNTLTQRAIGPESTATVRLDASGLRVGDHAGLGLLNIPAAWIGVVREEGGAVLRWHAQEGGRQIDVPLESSRVYLRAGGDFEADLAQLAYSFDGQRFTPLGAPIRLPYGLKTFQGVRYALFAYNGNGHAGGHADFDDFTVDEPLADRSRNIPFGQVVRLANLADGSQAWISPLGMLHSTAAQVSGAAGEDSASGTRFRVHDRGQGKVALEVVDGGGFLTVVGAGLAADVRVAPRESAGSLFMWQDLLRGEAMLLSLLTHRYVGLAPGSGEPYSADRPGTRPDRRDGVVLEWRPAH
jgi:xylan 1,4-beta-xylosidase